MVMVVVLLMSPIRAYPFYASLAPGIEIKNTKLFIEFHSYRISDRRILRLNTFQYKIILYSSQKYKRTILHFAF